AAQWRFWRERAAVSSTGLEMPEAASRQLDTLLTETPEQTWLLAWRARNHAAARRWPEAEADWQEVLKREPDSLTPPRERAASRARRGRFADAVTDLTVVWQTQRHLDDGVQLATAQWGAGDRAGWRRTCEELVARRTAYAGDADTLTAVALLCSLQP